MKKTFLFLVIAIITYGANWPTDSVYQRAKGCVTVAWTPTVQNTDPWFYTTYGSTCTGANEIYLKCDFKAGTPYRSIAYSYGGEDSDGEFTDKLDRDYLVGSHLCHYQSYGDPSDTIAGTDCSGFLSYCWNVPRQSTGMFINNKNYLHIDRDSLRGGDALIKAGSHAVLVLDGTVPEETLIVESTSAVNGVRKRLIDVNSEYWLNYVPLRNPAIEGTMSVTKPLNKQTHHTFLQKDGLLLFANPVKNCVLRNLRGQQLLSASDIQHINLPKAKGVYILHYNEQGQSKTVKIMHQ